MPPATSRPDLDPVLASEMRPTHGHTRRDADELYAAGIDPATTQPREWPVRCLCGVSTFNVSARCDRLGCYQPPGIIARNAHAAGQAS